MTILAGFLFNMFKSSFLMFFITLIPFALFIAIIGLEIGVSFIQAYVLSLLTCFYIKDAEYLH
jgi:F-type H+-transporting ATPase subunit a